jgi:hypothetical protein
VNYVIEKNNLRLFHPSVYFSSYSSDSETLTTTTVAFILLPFKLIRTIAKSECCGQIRQPFQVSISIFTHLRETQAASSLYSILYFSANITGVNSGLKGKDMVVI